MVKMPSEEIAVYRKNIVGTSCLKPPSSACEEEEEVRRRLSPYGQEQVVNWWGQLSGEQRALLAAEVAAVDWDELATAFRETMANHRNQTLADQELEPIPQQLHEGVARCSPQQLEKYRNLGLTAVSEGRVAALLLAGGQGTRLGVNYPKGMFDVGLPSRKTLYQLQGERLLKLQELATNLTGEKGAIPWYIMTSEHTMEPTLEFFANHNYFGLQKENLVVFEQYMLPCLTPEGKVIMETPYRLAKAPDGNGGLFRALQHRGILADMERRGIQYVHVYCVDNILVKMADPVFIGYCISKEAECAAKVVEKVVPTEAVGVVCRVGGKFQVVEYSEISAATAQRRNPDGRLTFSAGNICNHFFTLDFLKQIGSGDKRLKYHIAQKKIPYVGDEGKTVKPLKTNGIKLEKFVFDVFEFSTKFCAWEVHREAEFSPLKNGDDSAAKDTPTTARLSLYSLHRQYVQEAGGRFDDGKGDSSFVSVDLNVTNNGEEKKDAAEVKNGNEICEISPLVSYAGEGLEELVAGKTFTGPVIINSPREQLPVCGNGTK